ncbi:MAG TPA: PAS domain S-box protein [Burkholderiales bacterium]|nr:PAS domain S-box protein [Burkholderiales bacterium]
MKIFGYSADEIIGKNIKILMPEDGSVSSACGMERYLKTGEVHVPGKSGTEFWGRRKDGSVFQLEMD